MVLPILAGVTDAAPAGFLSLGQPTARRMAVRATDRSRGSRTLLVHGPPGAGKGAFVDDILALSFCTDADPDNRPCNACRGCRDARARTHPDLVVGSPGIWRELRGTGESIVAAARRWLLDASGAPVVGDRRVVLIEQADEASEQIQNALLKTLEEPTDRHAFVLVADEPARLLPTIRSRSQPLRISPVPHRALVAHLMDIRRLPEDQADALARLANGLAGAAVDYADRTELIEWRRRTQARLLDLLARGRADRFEAVRDLLDEAAALAPTRPVAAADADGEAETVTRTPASVQRGAAMLVIDAWLALTRDLAVAGAGQPELAPAGELAPEVGRLGGVIGPAALVEMARLLEAIGDGLRQNASPRLGLERAMLAWPNVAS